MSQEIATKPETASLAEILGPPPLLAGENLETYQVLFDRVANSFGADNDIILTILSKRFADSLWEETRYRRQRAVSIDVRFAAASLCRPNARRSRRRGELQP